MSARQIGGKIALEGDEPLATLPLWVAKRHLRSAPIIRMIRIVRTPIRLRPVRIMSTGWLLPRSKVFGTRLSAVTGALDEIDDPSIADPALQRQKRQSVDNRHNEISDNQIAGGKGLASVSNAGVLSSHAIIPSRSGAVDKMWEWDSTLCRRIITATFSKLDHERSNRRR
jgi:hypothetical protein